MIHRVQTQSRCLPPCTVPVLLGVLGVLLSLAATAPVAASQEQARGRTRNPHGPLHIACENCHTSTSWSPIRPSPDFSHRETRFPLRGLHTNVACRLCHVRLEFSDVGTRCADCHADIHRRQFGGDCGQCHTVRGWKVTSQAIKGHQNRFPLLGAHASTECQSCHKNAAAGQFLGLSTECSSCHLKDYQAARNPDHKAANLPATCASCHRFDSWTGVAFDHARFTGFALSGAHTRLSCAECHTGGRYTGTPANCFSCHAREYTSTGDPSHTAAGFPTDCSKCHTTLSWAGASFDHNTTRFALTGAHSKIASCTACHVSGRFAGTPSDCYSCHIRDYERTSNPNHGKSSFSTSCATCHTTAGWAGAKFDHSLARFALTGAHLQAPCASCHKNGQYTGTPADCASCHLADFNGTKDPNHAAAGFPQTCETCHTTTQWKGAKFDHNTGTKFPLTGAHARVDCASCHKNGQYKGTSTDCVGCHLADFNGTKDPNHTAAGFPQTCETCHTTTQWKGAKFDHNTGTKFPLTGAHARVDCASCHKNGQYRGTSTDCVGCHLADFNGTKDPNHTAAGFPQTCETCHTTTQWKGAKFDHSTGTKFPLTGAHARVDCASCHKNGQYRGTSTDCVGCHLADFNGTKDPNHTAAGFPQTCETCHTTTQWKGAKFDHSTGTKFPLTGAHARVDCASCHKNGQYRGLPASCVSCHRAAYDSTTNPNHSAAGFPQDCAACHGTSQWSGARFDHNAATKFPLTGAHVAVSCKECHAGDRFAGTPADCYSCHSAAYTGTKNPPHVSSGFPRDCTLCHSTSGWQGAVFDHSRTRFTLTGAHTTAQCVQCHVNNVFAGTPTQCVACHLSEYGKTTNPNHAAAGFPQDCSLCHATTGWQGAKFDHTATKFPLTGAHVAASCAACHSGGVYAGLNTSCVSCHLTNFNNTRNPDHKAGGFPQQCEICHGTAAWTPASFDHARTGFPLTGAHTSVQCVNCHVGGRYQGTPTDCYSCHQLEYRSVTDPNHAAAGFPTNCTLCHTTATWSGAKFNHTFPIYSGSHAGKWNTCGECHPNSSNYSVFSCTNCHEHEKTKMDQEHRDVRNYVYNSANCYSCHPNGRH